jgi:hypothetical protein
MLLRKKNLLKYLKKLVILMIRKFNNLLQKLVFSLLISHILIIWILLTDLHYQHEFLGGG